LFHLLASLFRGGAGHGQPLRVGLLRETFLRDLLLLLSLVDLRTDETDHER
jgi:hypothetical protein